jgi:hypothetical protein
MPQPLLLPNKKSAWFNIQGLSKKRHLQAQAVS